MTMRTLTKRLFQPGGSVGRQLAGSGLREGAALTKRVASTGA